MKALVVSAPGEVEVKDVPAPVVNSDEALLRVRMVGMCGSDLTTYRT